MTILLCGSTCEMLQAGIETRLSTRHFRAIVILSVSEVDNQALLANTPASAKSLLHSLELTAKSIGLCVNTDKTQFICFKQNRLISAFNGRPLKIVEQLIYLSSNISSTENHVNIRVRKGLTVIDKLSVIWKSEISDKI